MNATNTVTQGLRILVVDDNDTHRRAARAQLVGNDVTIVGSYDDAQDLLAGTFDMSNGDASKWGWKGKQPFDVVLVDLLLPASGREQGPDGDRFVGQEMPIGIFLALLAAKQGSKHVAVFTDSDHHSHPASTCFDIFNKNDVEDGGESRPSYIVVDGGKVMLVNNRNWLNRFDPADLSKVLEYAEYKERTDTVRAKNWGAVLSYLLK